MVIINAVKCLLCGDTIFSRTNHDFRSCYCGNVSVDGGPYYHDDSGMVGGEKYGRIMMHQTNMAEIDDVNIDLTVIDLNNIGKILFEDWNHNKNEYGLTQDHTYSDEQREAAKAKIALLK